MAKLITFYHKANCTTCKRAKTWLSEQGVTFQERELAKQPLNEKELLHISGGKPATLIDRRKPSFRALGIGARELSDKEALELMGKNPSIIRRPIYEIDGKVFVGVEEAEVAKHLK